VASPLDFLLGSKKAPVGKAALATERPLPAADDSPDTSDNPQLHRYGGILNDGESCEFNEAVESVCMSLIPKRTR
jgi:hypothetical protein